MPPTTPHAGLPRYGVVFAQLIVEDEKRGIRPFFVKLTETDSMCPGITSRALPRRPGGVNSVDHAITTFNHVRVPSNMLLGSIEMPQDMRKDFYQQIQRVGAGTLSISLSNISSLRMCAYIAGKYSLRREVSNPKETGKMPIITFSTQHRPILTSLAMASVFEEFSKSTIDAFMDTKQDPRVRHGFACVFKATLIHTTQSLLGEMMDRCGWQGLMAFNQISEVFLAQRGNNIAEGDVLVLCIRKPDSPHPLMFVDFDQTQLTQHLPSRSSSRTAPRQV